MSLDLTLYASKPQDGLAAALSEYLHGTPFATYEDWKHTYPPGPFDRDILSDFGIDIKVTSVANFRLRKDGIEEQMMFVRTLRDSLQKTADVALLLNGEPFS